jgi:hypothetical protein
VQTWSLTTSREEAIEIGARSVHHVRSVTFQLAERVVSCKLFVVILGRIGCLRANHRPVSGPSRNVAGVVMRTSAEPIRLDVRKTLSGAEPARVMTFVLKAR